MDNFSSTLNEMLVEMYHNILKMEENMIKNMGNMQLTINEIHLIECVGKGGSNGLTVSELALALRITKPSVTVAVNKLEQKGYVEKRNWKSDGRVVQVLLTHKGKIVDNYHRFYHRNLVKEISDDFTAEEKVYLLKAIKKLNEYFLGSIGEQK